MAPRRRLQLLCSFMSFCPACSLLIHPLPAIPNLLGSAAPFSARLLSTEPLHTPSHRTGPADTFAQQFYMPASSDLAVSAATLHGAVMSPPRSMRLVDVIRSHRQHLATTAEVSTSSRSFELRISSGPRGLRRCALLLLSLANHCSWLTL